VPNRDNLKFIAIAKYKAMRDGDVLQFEMIDKRLTSKPSVRGLALSSSSIQQLEKLKHQSNFYGSEEDVQVDVDSLDRYKF